MKSVKVVRITPDEVRELTLNYKDDGKESLDDLLKSISNQTLLILRQLKSTYEWDDIEDMVNYVAILKKVMEAKDHVKLDDDELKLVVTVFEKSVKSKKISGFALEKVVEIYKEFKNAS